MSTAAWLNIEEIFHAACALPASARSEFVQQRAAGNASISREVMSLLASFEGSPQFLESSVMEAIAAADPEAELRKADENIGRRIGAYTLVRLIGSGGMGAVYLAERAGEDFQQRVAIKLIRRGMDTDDILHRFRRERQMLANLAHPNIAHLLDGGTTDNGRPYLVMEYVEGVPLDAYCDVRRLGIAERLSLFRTVCAAVHFAHQNLIVHRDLKPSNILVTEAPGQRSEVRDQRSDGVADSLTSDFRPLTSGLAHGEVKLLDFGIARVLAPDSHGDGTNVTRDLTQAGDRRLTPAYASPEQIRGETITTAADVYSLGVICYELLTGRRPYPITAANSLLEIESIVGNTQPARPSEVVGPLADRTADSAQRAESLRTEQIAALRSTDPARLKRALRGDLDVILLTALRKEPQRRYGSAAAMSADIGRYLNCEPISARPDSWSYRTSTFIRRNRWPVAAAAAIVALIVAGSIAVSALAFRLSGALDEVTAQKNEAQLEYNRAVSATFVYLRMITELAAEDDAVRERVIAELQHRSDRLDAREIPIAPAAEISAREAIGRAARTLSANDLALRQCTRIIELSEGVEAEHRARLSALTLAGLIHFELGEHDQAIERLSAGLITAPLRDEDIVLVEALLLRERRDEAIAAARRVPLPPPPFDGPLREKLTALEQRFNIRLNGNESSSSGNVPALAPK